MKRSGGAAAIEARRRRVAGLRLAGETSRTRVAAELGISVPTASRDFQELDRQWREQANPDDIAAVKGRDIHRTEALIAAIWGKATNPGESAQNSYIDRVVSLLERRAKYLGLDSPTKIAPTDPTGTREYSSLTDGERQKRIVAILGIEISHQSEESAADGVHLRLEGPQNG